MSETERPKYSVAGKFWAAPPHVPSAQLFEQGAVIEYDGAPNASLTPLNDAARARVAAWRSGLQKNG
jgi:hypothetical protein